MELSAYDFLDRFSLHDAGFLLCGIEPLPPKKIASDDDPHEIERQTAKRLTEQLILDARAGRLKVENIDGDDALIERNRRPEGRFGRDAFRNYSTEWFVTRRELADWAIRKGKTVCLFPESASLMTDNQKSIESEKGYKIFHIGNKKSWLTLQQAAEWLSAKTQVEWTAETIVDFSINQCRPDDLVEDYKYPTYLRTILPETICPLLRWIALCGEEPSKISDIAYVNQSIDTGAKKANVTFLFKENLEELKMNGESSLLYVSSDKPFINTSELRPVVVYCELRPLMWSLDDSLQFPSLPIIEINHETIGIRHEELKQLLRDYLELQGQKLLRQSSGKKARPEQQDKKDFQEIAARLWKDKPTMTQAEIINHQDVAGYKRKYKGKNTLTGWAREVDPRKGEKRGRPKNKQKIERH